MMQATESQLHKIKLQEESSIETAAANNNNNNQQHRRFPSEAGSSDKSSSIQIPSYSTASNSLKVLTNITHNDIEAQTELLAATNTTETHPHKPTPLQKPLAKLKSAATAATAAAAVAKAAPLHFAIPVSDAASLLVRHVRDILIDDSILRRTTVTVNDNCSSMAPSDLSNSSNPMEALKQQQTALLEQKRLQNEQLQQFANDAAYAIQVADALIVAAAAAVRPVAGAYPGGMPAARTANEADRLRALTDTEIMDSDQNENDFDALTRLASSICDVPISLISLIDSERQWFKSKKGLSVCETSRDLAFCAHAILNPSELFIVPDTYLDKRFADSPLVLGPPFIRFYCGSVMLSSDSFALGTLCVIDVKPRTLTANQKLSLADLSAQAASQLELRRGVRLLRDSCEQLRSTQEQLTKAKNESDVANKSKSMFLASMSHEIRTPFTGLLGNLSILSETQPLTLEQTDCINVIQTTATHLLTICNDILDLSKYDDSAMKLEQQQTNVSETIEQAIELAYNKAKSGEVDVVYQLEPDVPLVILADATRLRQIFANLISNAQKFSQRGTIVVNGRVNRNVERKQLRVTDGSSDSNDNSSDDSNDSNSKKQHRRAESGSGSGQTVEMIFEVSDDGIGMSAAGVASLFTAFTQVHQQTTSGKQQSAHQYGGTGLGLTISSRLAGLMGGQLSVERSVEEVGTVMKFTMMTTVVQDVTATEPTPAVLLSVLIVDSNPAVCSSIASSLARTGGYTTTIATTVAEAVEAVDNNNSSRSKPFDVFIIAKDNCVRNVSSNSSSHSIRGSPQPNSHCSLKNTATTAGTPMKAAAAIAADEAAPSPELPPAAIALDGGASRSVSTSSTSDSNNSGCGSGFFTTTRFDGQLLCTMLTSMQQQHQLQSSPEPERQQQRQQLQSPAVIFLLPCRESQSSASNSSLNNSSSNNSIGSPGNNYSSTSVTASPASSNFSPFSSPALSAFSRFSSPASNFNTLAHPQQQQQQQRTPKLSITPSASVTAADVKDRWRTMRKPLYLSKLPALIHKAIEMAASNSGNNSSGGNVNNAMLLSPGQQYGSISNKLQQMARQTSEGGIGSSSSSNDNNIAAMQIPPLISSRSSSFPNSSIRLSDISNSNNSNNINSPKQKYNPQLSSLHPARILVVDDNAINRSVVLKMLSMLGYHAYGASSNSSSSSGSESCDDGRVAMSLIIDQHQRYDLVLMDQLMQHVNGVDATIAILGHCREQEEQRRQQQAGQEQLDGGLSNNAEATVTALTTAAAAYHTPKIISFSANVLDEDTQLCLAAGMIDQLSKPVSIVALQSIIIKHTQQQQK